MRIEPLGDSAAILRDLGEPAWAIASALRSLPDIQEAVASYDTVGLYFECGRFPWIRPMVEAALSSVTLESGTPSKLHSIPVCYGLGDDLDEAASELGIGREALIEMHAATTYLCFAVGFVPGFPYLGYLDETIGSLSRKATPRIRVPAGSVGIAGRQTGIYPAEVPGGWRLIGRTPLVIADMDRAFFPISPGDAVKFEPIGEAEYERKRGETL